MISTLMTLPLTEAESEHTRNIPLPGEREKSMPALSLKPSPSLADAILGNEGNTLFRNALLVLAGSVLIAISAQIVFRLPISPVPITGQTFAVLIVGMALGPRLGALAAIAYLIEGIWFPVFAEARTWAHPFTLWTAGYLAGFVGAAYVTGWLAQQGWDRHPFSTAVAMVLGNIAIYIPGTLWLSYMYAVNTDFAGMALVGEVATKGFALFLIGDALKLVLAVLAFPMAWKWVSGRR